MKRDTSSQNSVGGQPIKLYTSTLILTEKVIYQEFSNTCFIKYKTKMYFTVVPIKSSFQINWNTIQVSK